MVGPILFCPQPTLWSIRPVPEERIAAILGRTIAVFVPTLRGRWPGDDLSEFWCFVIGTSNAERGSVSKERKAATIFWKFC